jgi:hypothetical protein
MYLLTWRSGHSTDSSNSDAPGHHETTQNQGERQTEILEEILGTLKTLVTNRCFDGPGASFSSDEIWRHLFDLGVDPGGQEAAPGGGSERRASGSLAIHSLSRC